MKYIVMDDITDIIKSKYRLIIVYLCSILILYLSFDIKNVINLEDIKYMLDIIFSTTINLKSLTADILKAIYFILNYGLSILIALSIFFKDIDNSDNLFLRIKVSKWIDAKIISNIIVTFVLNFIFYLVTRLYSNLDNLLLMFFIKKGLIVVTIIMCIYILLIIKEKCKWLFFILGIIFLGTLYSINIDIVSANFFYIFGVFAIIGIILKIISHFIKFSDVKG